MSASTLKTTKCQPRRPTVKLPITMKKFSFYLTNILEVYGFLGHDAKQCDSYQLFRGCSLITV